MLQAAYLRDRFALELKYQELHAPLFSRRRDLINGPPGSDPKLRGFWLDAMKHHSVLSELIEPYDEPALALLTDITMTEFEKDGTFGFELTFHFHPNNPYFKNATLSKRLVVSNLYSSGNPNVESNEGTVIEWNAGKKLTTVIEEQKVKRASRGGKRGGVQIIRKEVPRPSFFSYFATRQMPTQEEMQKMKDEELQHLNEADYIEYMVSFTLRNKILPNAIDWYLGNAEDSDAEDDEDYEVEKKKKSFGGAYFFDD